MDPFIGGAAIGAGSQLVSSIFNIGQAKKERRFQREMATTAYQRDVEMWNKQNEYNAPSAQRARLEEANLNPALMYKGAPQNVATQMPKHQSYATPTAKLALPDVMSMLSQFQQIKGQRLSNDAQSITNEFLWQKLFGKNALDMINVTKGGNDIDRHYYSENGKHRSPVKVMDFDMRPYENLYLRKKRLELGKTQAQTENILLDSAMKKMMGKSMDKLPPWARQLLPIVQTLIGIAPSAYGNYQKYK